MSSLSKVQNKILLIPPMILNKPHLRVQIKSSLLLFKSLSINFKPLTSLIGPDSLTYAIHTTSVINPKFMFMLFGKVNGHMCIISNSPENVINCISPIRSWRFLTLLHSDIQSYGY